MSDNAETREALRRRFVGIIHGWHHETSISRPPDWTKTPSQGECPYGSPLSCSGRQQAERAAVDLLAALPPVAGPEVRPDETLRAAVEALCDEADHVATGSTGKPVGAIVRVRDLRVALAARAPASGDEGHAHGPRGLAECPTCSPASAATEVGADQ